MASLRRPLLVQATLTVLAVSAAQASPQPTDSVRFKSVAAARGYTCAVTIEGALYCWGISYFDREPGRRIFGHEVPRPGRLQLCGLVNCRKTPLRILERSTFTQVSTGSAVCGIQTDGRTWCWGARGYGQTGVREDVGGADDTVLAQPREVQTDARFTTISAGTLHTCGLAADSTAYCWGHAPATGVTGRTCGRRMPETCVTTPTRVRDTRFLSIVAGNEFSCGLHEDGKAECWGALTLAPTDQTFRTISAGTEHACAIGTDDLAYCWGRGREGQLGAGSMADSAAPTPVAGGLKFRTVSAGGRYTCGLSAEGAAHCWGTGAGGQLGFGDTTSSATPRPVAGGLSFQAIATGWDHSCAIATSGAMYCWGKNGWANLGNGGRDDSRVPVRVAEP